MTTTTNTTTATTAPVTATTTAPTTTTDKVRKAPKRHGVATRTVLTNELGMMLLHSRNINFTLANDASKMLTKAPAGLTRLGRHGNAKFDNLQPVSGIIDNWLCDTLSCSELTADSLESLFSTIANAENFTSKLKPASKQGSKAIALHSAIATLTHVINCFQAMRLESKHNTLKKLYALGYTHSAVTTIVLGLNQVAHTLRPDLMGTKARLVKQYKALQTA